MIIAPHGCVSVFLQHFSQVLKWEEEEVRAQRNKDSGMSVGTLITQENSKNGVEMGSYELDREVLKENWDLGNFQSVEGRLWNSRLDASVGTSF